VFNATTLLKLLPKNTGKSSLGIPVTASSAGVVGFHESFASSCSSPPWKIFCFAQKETQKCHWPAGFLQVVGILKVFVASAFTAALISLVQFFPLAAG